MLITRPSILVSLSALAVILLQAAGAAQTLDSLTRIQNYTAQRVSSSDSSGGNLDMRRVEAGKALTLAEIEGPAEITHIWFTHMYPSRSSLRKLVLRIWFDDIEDPCVEAPLGDFFGLGHAQTYAYASQPLAVGTHGGLNSYWRMPFTKRARIEVANDGAQDCVALYYQIDYRKLARPPRDGLRFFAAYRQAFPPENGTPYIIMETDGGRGHFVGCNLSVEQKDEGWWGEGDVRIYVDGESHASIEGTGTEDDFGGAWCYSHEFSFPQFGAPLRGRFNASGILERCTPDLRGKDLDPWKWPQAWQVGDLWNIYRYHISDPIPFRESIRVGIEHGWQGNDQHNWYSSVAYWYQAGYPSSRTALPPVAERMPAYLRPHASDDGRWEAENLVDVAETSAGAVIEAGMHFWGEMFSGQHGLQWDAAAAGDTITLPFSVPRPGKYTIKARPCRGEAGGRFTLALNDLPAGEPIDLYQAPPFPGPFEITVAETDLQAGNHTIKIVALEPREDAKGCRLLLDWIQGSDGTASEQKPK